MRITDTHVYFWNGPFSQWYLSDFKDETWEEYCCAEQYMMAIKAWKFKDSHIRGLILDSKNPKEIKALGRAVQNFDPIVWDSIKFTVVKNANLYKFSCNDELLKLLMATENRILVEASPYDKIWGVGLAEENDMILDENNWRGENLLGRALTEVRDWIKEKGKFDYDNYFKEYVPPDKGT